MPNISETKFALDTNILVYLLDKNSTFHSRCLKKIKKIKDDGNQLVITQQNLVELIQTLTDWYKIKLPQAIKQAERITATDLLIISPLPYTWKSYLELCRNGKKSKDHFDLFLAVTLIDNGIPKILTNDKLGFAGISGLEVVLL